MKSSSSKIVIATTAGAFIVLLATLAWYGVFDEKKQQEVERGTETPKTSPWFRTSPPPPTAIEKAQEYTHAVNIHPYRIQFSDCHGAVTNQGVGTLSVKQGVLVMLDNRDAVRHVITVGSQKVRIEGRDYAVITASEAGTFQILCDGGGAAQLNVEK